MTFKQKGREEPCEMDDPIPVQNIGKLYGLYNWQLIYGNFIWQKIKVGTEIFTRVSKKAYDGNTSKTK